MNKLPQTVETTLDEVFVFWNELTLERSEAKGEQKRIKRQKLQQLAPNSLTACKLDKTQGYRTEVRITKLYH